MTNLITVALWNPSKNPDKNSWATDNSFKQMAIGRFEKFLSVLTTLSPSLKSEREKARHVQGRVETWNAAQHNCW